MKRKKAYDDIKQMIEEGSPEDIFTAGKQSFCDLCSVAPDSKWLCCSYAGCVEENGF